MVGFPGQRVVITMVDHSPGVVQSQALSEAAGSALEQVRFEKLL
jgi:hypothetical protein